MQKPCPEALLHFDTGFLWTDVAKSKEYTQITSNYWFMEWSFFVFFFFPPTYRPHKTLYVKCLKMKVSSVIQTGS